MPYEDYWVEDDTLIVRGSFFGVSTGLLGGWKKVSYVFNHTVGDEFHSGDPVTYLRGVARKFEQRYKLRSYFGLLTSVPMDKLSVEFCGEVTAFVTAGVKNPNDRVDRRGVGTINIITVFECRLSRGAMLNAIITATESKSKALLESGYNFTGTSTDAVVVLCKGTGKYHKYAGPASDAGRKLWKAVAKAVKESLGKW
jgi:adenosylcobinamide hydrolase